MKITYNYDSKKHVSRENISKDLFRHFCSSCASSKMMLDKNRLKTSTRLPSERLFRIQDET